jgi:hypothetical protein
LDPDTALASLTRQYPTAYGRLGSFSKAKTLQKTPRPSKFFVIFELSGSKYGYIISRAWAVLHETKEEMSAEGALKAAARRTPTRL